ncbi:hypothetical protein [Enterocloster clostridioformis]|uniref:Uncharacterized protein n=1 Tax=Enterocloster clostridioformis TaxID=1531 RepID=A0A829WD11_9FIRM|nr:hypothetical protein [Enterocloster clostridioformis]ENZ28633.1 hypothetical protein HMPREF1087_01126 [[Clostridium] clostridioforme 90A1]ENZ73436.1 hypothetical protein HMPREF1081_00045 [[Clostridium] clostridioforme 90A4]GEA37481.1 hypothetical protein Ccl03g_31940 [Enterocloster clostridioformis]
MTKEDKIKLVKPMGAFTNVGEVCDIVDISEDGIISFKFGEGVHLGCMSYDEFERYFEIVEGEDANGDVVADEFLEDENVYEVLAWCKENDKPFYPNLYINIVSKLKDEQTFTVGLYSNRMCLAQYRNKTFKDSDFSTVRILI